MKGKIAVHFKCHPHIKYHKYVAAKCLRLPIARPGMKSEDALAHIFHSTLESYRSANEKIKTNRREQTCIHVDYVQFVSFTPTSKHCTISFFFVAPFRHRDFGDAMDACFLHASEQIKNLIAFVCNMIARQPADNGREVRTPQTNSRDSPVTPETNRPEDKTVSHRFYLLVEYNGIRSRSATKITFICRL